jgi:hypothetical protein
MPEPTSKRKARQRYFLKDGTEVPGVTTILGIIHKPALVPWANNLGLKGIKVGSYVDELATIGQLAHSMVEALLKGGPEPDWATDFTGVQIERAKNSVQSFLAWQKGKDMETMVAETPLVSEKMRCGGTPDWYGRIGNRRVLLDLKTGKGIYPEYYYQLGAYRQLLLEAGHDIDAAHILVIPRTESERFLEQVIPATAIRPYYRVFRSALTLYRAIKEVKT